MGTDKVKTCRDTCYNSEIFWIHPLVFSNAKCTLSFNTTYKPTHNKISNFVSIIELKKKTCLKSNYALLQDLIMLEFL